MEDGIESPKCPRLGVRTAVSNNKCGRVCGGDELESQEQPQDCSIGDRSVHPNIIIGVNPGQGTGLHSYWAPQKCRCWCIMTVGAGGFRTPKGPSASTCHLRVIQRCPSSPPPTTYPQLLLFVGSSVGSSPAAMDNNALSASDFEYGNDNAASFNPLLAGPPRSQYQLPASEQLRGVANRIIFSRYYLLFYLVMMALSLATVVLSLIATSAFLHTLPLD